VPSGEYKKGSFITMILSAASAAHCSASHDIMQSFNFRSIAFPEIQLDKNITYNQFFSINQFLY